jgi:hypothetical protein
MRRLVAVMGLMGACVGLAAAEPVPLPRPRPPVWAPPEWAAPSWTEPKTFREAAGADFDTTVVTAAPSECSMRLEKIAAIARIPRLVGPGACGGGDMVRLDAVMRGEEKIEIKPAPYLRCPVAEQFALWVRDDAVPRLAGAGLALRRVDSYDDFNCRGRNRASRGKVSEHGKGNAVDLRGFTLADGRFIALTDVHVDKALRAAMRENTCARFTTVLGPGSDGHHEAHIHLDLIERRNGYRICQWDVREPPPPPPPKPRPGAETVTNAKPETGTVSLEFVGPIPLPPPRPTMADMRRRGRRF